MSFRGQVLVAAWIVSASLLGAYHGVANAAAGAKQSTAVRALSQSTTGKAALHRDAGGRVTHLRAATAPLAVDPELNPDARARAVLKQYRDAFLDPSTPLDLVTTRVAPIDTSGHSHVRYQQRVNGIPVRGGNVIVHLDTRGVTAVHSKLQSGLAAVNAVPELSADEARLIAERELTRLFPRTVLSFTAPALEIVNAGVLLQKRSGSSPSRLAWFTEVRGNGVREYVWIDATNGALLLHFSQMAHATAGAVAVEDATGSCLAALNNPPYYDSDALPVLGDALSAYTNATHAYDYFTGLGRAGFAGNDTPTAISIVNVCDADFPQPIMMERASWDGTQMAFATGTAAANDVVGHEFTHGVIDYSSMLNLVSQSGALAEGFADVFGETIDLTSVTNGTRWAFGENATGGAFRNLMTPNTFNLPEKVTDTKFYCGTDNDVWMHTNGAVLAHAFALLVDGGTYNGYTIGNIGIAKAARIYYEAMVALTPTATFQDAYLGLKTAADTLVNSAVITSDDRTELYKALDAVELNVTPCSTKLEYCPAGFTNIDSFTDDFETTNSGKWLNTSSGVNHWNGGAGTPGIYYLANPAFGFDPAAMDSNGDIVGAVVGIKPYRGQYALWADAARSSSGVRLGASIIEMASAVTLPATGDVRLQFEGRFYFEQLSSTDAATGLPLGPDGGTIEYSTDGGTTWQNVETAAGSLISAGQGYTGIIQTDQGNPLGGQYGFVGSLGSTGYSSTQLNLASLAGQSVKFRFHVGTDQTGTNGMGWQVDDVAIYSCAEIPAVTPPTTSSKKKGGGDIGIFALCLLALLFTHRNFIKSRRV